MSDKSLDAIVAKAEGAGWVDDAMQAEEDGRQQGGRDWDRRR
jgi:hypothetical protein